MDPSDEALFRKFLREGYASSERLATSDCVDTNADILHSPSNGKQSQVATDLLDSDTVVNPAGSPVAPDTNVDLFGNSDNQDTFEYRSGYRIISQSDRPIHHHNFASRVSEINANARSRPLISTIPSTTPTPLSSRRMCDGSTHCLNNPKGILIGKNLKAKCSHCKATAVHTEMSDVVKMPCLGSETESGSCSSTQKSRSAHRLTERSGSIVCLKKGCGLSFPASEVVWRTPKEREMMHKENRTGKRSHRKSTGHEV